MTPLRRRQLPPRRATLCPTQQHDIRQWSWVQKNPNPGGGQETQRFHSGAATGLEGLRALLAGLRRCPAGELARPHHASLARSQVKATAKAEGTSRQRSQNRAITRLSPHTRCRLCSTYPQLLRGCKVHFLPGHRALSCPKKALTCGQQESRGAAARKGHNLPNFPSRSLLGQSTNTRYGRPRSF